MEQHGMESSQTTEKDDVCRICSKEVRILYIYGTTACRACAAFFARSVKDGKKYECKKNYMACSDDSVNGVSAIHACKKCRFERCLREGMKEEYLKSMKRPFLETLHLSTTTRSEQLPLLSSTLRAIEHVNKYRFYTNSKVVFGTSEVNGRYFTGLDYRQSFVENSIVFRRLFDFLPVLSGLDGCTKECMFKNSLSLYAVLMHSVNNAHHLFNGSDENRFYVFPNKYVDLDDLKLAEYFTTYHKGVLQKGQIEALQMIGRITKRVMLLQRNSVSFAVREHFMTDEDFAAFIIMIIIHTNSSNMADAEWQRAIARLKKIWKELDTHYRITKRNPAMWGNLMFFMSTVQTVSKEYVELMTIHDLTVGNNMYIKTVNEEKSVATKKQMEN
ncbi:hypothetical protein QR680_004656 [Steinernema hermaphroditum]|uniref:Nuclear receptor domain-containing protein n=1 Tax=Steinernema hermaphroditum TaxID=289476 RepID=A0AA39HQJ5_9BILA|nr:hypothetical protein QR680_004656 [Steinernema hermaphroditum]